MDWITAFFSREFLPHGHCIFWTPWLLWSRVIADSTIALAYYVIPGMMVLFARRYGLSVSTISSRALVALIYFFATFILLCGLTHFMDAYTMWVPIYGIDVVIRVLCAIASVGTGVLVWIYGTRHAEREWDAPNLNRRILNVAERLERLVADGPH